MKKLILQIGFFIMSVCLTSLYSNADSYSYDLKIKSEYGMLHQPLQLKANSTKVKINDKNINEITDYPTFIYKDIIYVPMSANVLNSLNLSSIFEIYNHKIYTTANSNALKKYPENSIYKSKKYPVLFAQYNVFINDIEIYNINGTLKSNHPVLFAFGLTYIPMTYDNCNKFKISLNYKNNILYIKK